MQPGTQPPVKNYMVMSVVAILFFWPLAIPAIINAAKVNPALQQGDYAGAQNASAQAKKWARLAIIIGIVLWVLIIVCNVILAIAANNS